MQELHAACTKIADRESIFFTISHGLRKIPAGTRDGSVQTAGAPLGTRLATSVIQAVKEIRSDSTPLCCGRLRVPAPQQTRRPVCDARGDFIAVFR
jgi:hypothetical protein